ncbi:MAG: polysaccharide deacetylase family protein [Xanthomonadales bacterium]|nr:polysaccharide deacetylase family protein [Xanthomonadales bacterium]
MNLSHPRNFSRHAPSTRPAPGRLKFLLLLCVACCTAPASSREIALTFDDAPRPSTALLGGRDRASLLIDQLQRAGVEQAGIFVVANRLDAEGIERIGRYAAAGHMIANHSFTHTHLRTMTTEAYLEDVAKADAALRGLPGFTPLFRFPYLDEGDTVEKRDAVRAGLQAMGYRQGYVTIDDYDWYIDALAQKAVEQGTPIDRDALCRFYVTAITAAADFHDDLAVKHLGRSPRHVLLLHENDIAALCVGQLVQALKQQDWTLTRVSRAFEDPIAEQTPETMLLGQGRVAALAVDHGAPKASVFGPYEEEAELDRLFAEQVIVK